MGEYKLTSREQRTNTAIQAVTDAQIESEEVISEALNDFNTRVEVVEDAEGHSRATRRRTDKPIQQQR